MIHPRLRVALGAVAGGLLASAFLPIAVASADEFYYVPEPNTFDATEVSGMPPFTPVEATGAERWGLLDATTGHESLSELTGTDTFTQFGSYTNDFLVDNSTARFGGDLYDLTNFGGGFENEWIDITTPILGAGGTSGVSDLLITPFGDFQLFGDFPFTV
jgi:hypothetical protein